MTTDIVSQRKINRMLFIELKRDYDFAEYFVSRVGQSVYAFLCSTATTYERVYAYHQGTPMTGYSISDGVRRHVIFVRGRHYKEVAPILEFYELYKNRKFNEFEVLSSQVFDFTASRKGYLEFLETGLVKGKMSELFTAISLYRDFSLKGYMSSSYECQVFLDYLTDERYKEPAGNRSRGDYLNVARLMLMRCEVEGTLMLYKSKFVRHDFTYKEGSFLDEKVVRFTSKDNKTGSGKSLPLLSAPRKLQDLVNKKLNTLFTVWSETKDKSNTFYLRVLSKSFSNDVDLSFFKSTDSSVRIVKNCDCNFVVACIESYSETKVISESSVNFKRLTFTYSKNTDTLNLTGSLPLAKEDAPSFKLNSTSKDFKIVSMSENGSVICRSYNRKPLLVSWSYSSGFITRLKRTINVPAVRNKLGKFYCEAFDLLMKNKEAFESKYLSNEVDIYNFYYGLLDCYSSFATTNSGMFKVRDLKETEEDFSEDTIRQAIKVVNSQSDSRKKELKEIKKSAKGTNVRI